MHTQKLLIVLRLISFSVDFLSHYDTQCSLMVNYLVFAIEFKIIPAIMTSIS